MKKKLKICLILSLFLFLAIVVFNFSDFINNKIEYRELEENEIWELNIENDFDYLQLI